jgi:hypothetical protein
MIEVVLIAVVPIALYVAFLLGVRHGARSLEAPAPQAPAIPRRDPLAGYSPESIDIMRSQLAEVGLLDEAFVKAVHEAPPEQTLGEIVERECWRRGIQVPSTLAIALTDARMMMMGKRP